MEKLKSKNVENPRIAGDISLASDNKTKTSLTILIIQIIFSFIAEYRKRWSMIHCGILFSKCANKRIRLKRET